MSENQAASLLHLFGAGSFGCLIGWFIYFLNRYRKSEIKIGDLVTVIGAIGGGSVLTLFPASTDLFGAYGIGLFVGFFGYFVILNIYVLMSDNFDKDYFLDGRRILPDGTWFVPELADQATRSFTKRLIDDKTTSDLKIK